MFDKLKIKLAACRVKRKRDFAAADKRIMKKDSYAKRVLLWPFRMIGRGLRWLWDVIVSFVSWIWELICGINLIGLLNLTLIVAIIVLFSLLIINLVNMSRKSVVVMVPAKGTTVQIVGKKQLKSVKKLVSEPVVLPLKRDAQTGNLELGHVANIAGIESGKDKANSENLYGDVIVETRAERNMLSNGTKVNGNLYLQNMRKYVLPCDVNISGNLFLRNVGVLQFCGKFTVSGNIYVSPRSSFGPLPSSAKLGGQIIM